jgi:hypothetical protein
LIGLTDTAALGRHLAELPVDVKIAKFILYGGVLDVCRIVQLHDKKNRVCRVHSSELADDIVMSILGNDGLMGTAFQKLV